MAEKAGETPELLERLSLMRLPVANRQTELPARRDDGTPTEAPNDPGSREIEGRGKSPGEVLADIDEQRQARQTPTDKTVDEDPDTGKPPAKVAAPVKKYKIKGEELTLKEIHERGWLDDLVTTANQFPLIQKKYQELLESNAAKAAASVPATPEAQAQAVIDAQAQHEKLTLQVIKAYEPAAKREIQFYIANGLLDQDMADAYEKSVISMFGIFLYHLDAIQANHARTEQAIGWIKSQVDLRNAHEVKSILDTAIDAVAKNTAKNKLYDGIRDTDTRTEFVKWLREVIDPKVESINEKNIGHLWMAFTAETVAEFVKSNQEDDKVRQPTRRAQGDGTGARAATPESPEPPTLLERMHADRFPAEQ